MTKMWYAGVAYDNNEKRSRTFMVCGDTYELACEKFFTKFKYLKADPDAFVDMYAPHYNDEWFHSDGDYDFIEINEIDTSLNRMPGLRQYIKH